ncbi:hypothetical protein DPMN_113278 [Dreissena polymorpha]|uniref:Uncharacterized protein n=1 Tax=Dreissena polymorpha TaxID=45954 RepID=A0A9D4KHP2_DREPO|nr:hypothetical protein DPMN_113278 [Dreissena polymorpha]
MEEVTSAEESCMSLSTTSCSQHYRDPVEDQWDTLRITEEVFHELCYHATLN